MSARHRNYTNYLAFLVHRISGILLALFLPVHFHVLQLALHDARAFDSFAAWAERPMVKFAEGILIVLLAGHLTGGLRLLAIEFLPWHNWQKSIVAITFGCSFAMGLVYLLNVS